MDLKTSLNKLEEDKPIVDAFIQLLMKRIHEKFPGEDIRLEDVDLQIGIRKLNPVAQIYRLLDDINKEGISL